MRATCWFRSAAPQDADEPFRLESFSAAELVEMDWTQTFLVDGVIVEGEPCILAGAKKSLKTSLLCDLAIYGQQTGGERES